MPQSPPAICTGPNCTNRVRPPGRCPACKQQQGKDRRQQRGGTHIYNKTWWRLLREDTLAEQGFCQWVENDGDPRPCGSISGLHVDHKEEREPCRAGNQAAHNDGLMCDWCDRADNRQVLCHSHHSAKTGMNRYRR
ncbi:MAG: hypothetical protein K2Z81_15305 [Cyanobacteria bacterium]|nr:hypothetical protein [Cyanobacteriota bacterium]